jgi:threonine dehydrogenase-like Zn-dependent dehydrogenase
VNLPSPTGEGVRVKLRSAGICGSDLHLLDSEFIPSVTLGHEMAGVLEDGTGVAIEPLVPCGICEYCGRGDYNLCRSAPARMMGIGVDGGMAEEILVPERCLVPLPSSIRLRDACLVEPIAVAVHGMRRVGLQPGQKVAIIGGGSIGLSAVAAAHEAGVSVALEARHDAQREAGERLGAGAVSGDYDVVVESAGTESAFARAISLARPGATLVLLASYWRGLTIPGIELCLKELRVLASSMYATQGSERDFDLAARVLAGNPDLPDILITHRFPLEAAPEAFATARDRAQGAIKVVLEA